MARLILVRHARPKLDPDRPSASWVLSDEGRAASACLASKLLAYAPAKIFSSPEPKAQGTAEAMAEVLGLPVALDPMLVEHRRGAEPFRSAAEQEALIRRLFEEPATLVLGEETADQAHARFAEAVDRLSGEGVALLVAHGTVITLWLSRRFGLEPFAFWRGLTTPCAAVLSGDGASFELVA